MPLKKTAEAVSGFSCNPISYIDDLQAFQNPEGSSVVADRLLINGSAKGRNFLFRRVAHRFLIYAIFSSDPAIFARVIATPGQAFRTGLAGQSGDVLIPSAAERFGRELDLLAGREPPIYHKTMDAPTNSGKTEERTIQNGGT